jgi:hypothetical protein
MLFPSSYGAQNFAKENCLEKGFREICKFELRLLIGALEEVDNIFD